MSYNMSGGKYLVKIKGRIERRFLVDQKTELNLIFNSVIIQT